MIAKPYSGILLSMLLGLLAVPLATFDAQAEFISTQEALAIEKADAYARIDAWLMREDVAAEMAERGVDPAMARQRAAALSPQELTDLADRLDELPAGAGVLEVLGIVLVVLIVLELVGVTNIFRRR
ncbi:MAG: PA2779 family protein [Wenzhouxiangella sp.]